jgi:hypothetical protein
MKRKKNKTGDLIGQIIIASALVGLLILGYVSLKSNDSNRFRNIERLRGDHQAPVFHASKV